MYHCLLVYKEDIPKNQLTFHVYIGKMNFIMADFNQEQPAEQINPKVKYLTANAGVSLGHRLGEKFAYQLGVAGHNLNQPRESFEQ